MLKEELIASGSVDCTIRIWSLEADEALYILNGHSDNIYKLINISENTIASCDGEIFIWNFKEKEINPKFLEEKYGIYCIELISEELIASGGHSGNINVWNLKSSYCIF